LQVFFILYCTFIWLFQGACHGNDGKPPTQLNMDFKSWKNVIFMPLLPWKSVRKPKYIHWKSVIYLLFMLVYSPISYYRWWNARGCSKVP